MALILLTRVGHALLSLFAVTIFVFLLVRLTGDPINTILPDSATQADYDRVAARLGLDQPMWVQYFRFIGQVATGDFGYSLSLSAPVSDLLKQRFPATLQLSAIAIVIVLSVALPLGIYSAYWRGSWLDRVARGYSALAQATPSFWVGLLLVVLFAVTFRVVPPGGYGGLEYMILPAVTLSLTATAGLTRLLRSSMIEVLNADHIKFQRIKGLPERQVLWKHALRNGGLTALTFVGVLTANLVTGSVVTERVFVWPGVGSLLADAIRLRDFPVIQSVVLIFSAIYIAINLLVDFLYIILNPRLRVR